MLIKLIVVGKLKDKALAGKCAEYAAWLGKYGKFELLELPDAGHERNTENLKRAIEREKAVVWILSEEGALFNTETLAAKMKTLDRKLVLVIGDDAGLPPEIKQSGDLLLSLSPLTFTHEIARMLLLEQLFRCCNYNSGGAYHRP